MAVLFRKSGDWVVYIALDEDLGRRIGCAMVEKQILPFFDGVILVARELKPAEEVLLLRRDAEQLSRTWRQDWRNPYNRFSFVGLPGIPPKTKIAEAWLGYRDAELLGNLDEDSIAAVGQVESSLFHFATEFVELRRRRIRFHDYEFAETFAGGQLALERFASVSKVLLREDQDEIDRRYPVLVRRYLAQVPAQAVRVLVTEEYAWFRSHDPSTPLSFQLWGEDRYGYLTVQTDPAGATVSVDEQEWGPSPQENGVRAGSHHVVAVKHKLFGEGDVDVQAGGSACIDVKLSHLPRF